MKLRHKMMLYTGGTLLMLLAAMSITTYRMILENAEIMEKNNFLRSANVLERCLTSELDRIDTIAKDWATWDETYQFLESHDPAFIEKNLADQALANLKINIFLFIDSSGKILYSTGLNIDAPKKVAIPEELPAFFEADSPLLEPSGEGGLDSSRGILSLRRNSMLFSVHRVTTSDTKSPPNGFIVFGRLMDLHFVNQLQQMIQRQVLLIRTSDTAMDPVTRNALISLRAGESAYQAVSGENLLGFVLVRDVFKEPSLIARISIPMELYREARQHVKTQIIWILISGAVFYLVISLLLEQTILSRLKSLIEQIGKIRNYNDLSARVIQSGNDEFATLSKEMNNMLSSLQESRQEQHQAKISLIDKEIQFSTLFGQMPIGVGICLTDGRFVNVNRAYCLITGYSQEELLAGMTYMDITFPEDRGQESKIVSGIRDNYESVEYEKRYVRKDGSIRDVLLRTSSYMDVQGRRYLVGIATDITERKKAENELLKTKKLLSSAFDENSAGMIVSDARGGFVLANSAAAEILGEQVSGLIGADAGKIFSVWKMFDMDGKVCLPGDTPLMRALNGGEHTRGRLAEIRKGDGASKWIVVNAAPIRDEVGEIIMSVMVFSDMTEHLKREKDKEVLEEHLRKVQQLESLGQLAGSFAHDLNNFLVPILGYSDMISLTAANDEQICHSAREIRAAAERAKKLSQKLLALGGRQHLDIKPVDLNKVISDFKEFLRQIVGKGIEIEYRLDGGIGIIRADSSQIEQILMNLVVNARDAMPDGGSMVIETESVTFDEAYAKQNPDVMPGKYVMMSLTDTGAGMNDEVKSHLFEPLFTTKGPGKGTGLGLSIIQGVAKQHKGHISIWSEQGRGTSFKIYFPQSDGTAAESGEIPAAKSPFAKDFTILLAEDERPVRKFLSDKLKFSGYNVVEAGDGDEALSAAAEYKGRIDLLLTDVIMPKMNGRELYSKLSFARPEIKVIYMSGYSFDVLFPQGAVDSTVPFLRKPFPLEDLDEMLKAMMRSA